MPRGLGIIGCGLHYVDGDSNGLPRTHHCDTLWALVYVNDIILTSSNATYIAQFISKLHH